MILRVLSMVTVVLNGGSSSELCQPSSNAILANGSKRPDAFDCAPRPRRRAPSTAASASVGASKSIAPRRARRTRACWRDFSAIRGSGPDGCKLLRLAESEAIARLYTVLRTKQEHSRRNASRKPRKRPYWAGSVAAGSRAKETWHGEALGGRGVSFRDRRGGNGGSCRAVVRILRPIHVQLWFPHLRAVSRNGARSRRLVPTEFLRERRSQARPGEGRVTIGTESSQCG